MMTCVYTTPISVEQPKHIEMKEENASMCTFYQAYTHTITNTHTHTIFESSTIDKSNRIVVIVSNAKS